MSQKRAEMFADLELEITKLRALRALLPSALSHFPSLCSQRFKNGTDELGQWVGHFECLPLAARVFSCQGYTIQR